MDVKPIDRFGEDGYFEAMRNEFREATSPALEAAGPGGHVRQDQADQQTPAEPQPSGAAYQPEASWRDWITTW